jgi:hypothetical protein
MWVVPVEQGLHQCIQCGKVVTRKDITPNFEDLSPELRQRWETHERGQLPGRSDE